MQSTATTHWLWDVVAASTSGTNLIPALRGACDTHRMKKPHDLAAIVNHVNEEDLAALPLDDIRVLLEGIPRQRADPAAAAARRKLPTAILRSATQGDDIAFRSRSLH